MQTKFLKPNYKIFQNLKIFNRFLFVSYFNGQIIELQILIIQTKTMDQSRDKLYQIEMKQMRNLRSECYNLEKNG